MIKAKIVYRWWLFLTMLTKVTVGYPGNSQIAPTTGKKITWSTEPCPVKCWEGILLSWLGFSILLPIFITSIFLKFIFPSI